MTMRFPHHMLRRAAPRQIMLAAIEAGDAGVHLVCPKCGHDAGWVEDLSSTEIRRQPCPKCNNLSR